MVSNTVMGSPTFERRKKYSMCVPGVNCPSGRILVYSVVPPASAGENPDPTPVQATGGGATHEMLGALIALPAAQAISTHLGFRTASGSRGPGGPGMAGATSLSM